MKILVFGPKARYDAYMPEFARELGIDVVISDHHECKQSLPQAAAVVDPWREDCQYPVPDLCGAGVAFKLICALEGDTEGMLLEH